MDKVRVLGQSAFDLQGPLLFFPIRHHSPACSHHLEKIIREYKPEAILIEGPRDGNRIIPHLADKETQTPVAIYCSVKDRRGELGVSDKTYHCYYPFLDYSPELHALRLASEMKCEASFIDLPYSDYLPYHKADISYNSDYLLERSAYISLLCKKQGCRHFNELWEKLFEIDGFSMESLEFMIALLGYCVYARESYTQEDLLQDGTIAREKAMAQAIRKSQSKYNRTLVVTGGFHVKGIMDLLTEGQYEESTKESTPGDNLEKPESHSSLESQIYSMSYSFKSANQLGGYASGMPFPSFYQTLWEERGQANLHSRALLKYISLCGVQSRKKGSTVSLADEIEAYQVAKRLAALRGKREVGGYELIDSVISAFVKEDTTNTLSVAEEELSRLLVGSAVGTMTKLADTPPLVQDFYRLMKDFGLIKDSRKREVALQIYTRKKHRLESQFFYTMDFLDTHFCQKIHGPDFVTRTDMARVREVWSYQWNEETERSLIEKNMHGGTLSEVAQSFVGESLRENRTRAGEAAGLLIQSLLMGLQSTVAPLLDQLYAICQRDGGFSSLVDCLSHLNRCLDLDLLQSDSSRDRILDLISFTYQRCVSLLGYMGSLPQEEEIPFLDRLKEINYTQTKFPGCDGELFVDQLRELSQSTRTNRAICGAASGLLFGMKKLSSQEVILQTGSYLSGTGDQFLEASRFLLGLFMTARDILLTGDELIAGIDLFLEELEEDKFLTLLPQLRLAFSFFTPVEVDQIARRVVKHVTPLPQEAKTSPLSHLDKTTLLRIDEEVTEQLQEWGVL